MKKLFLYLLLFTVLFILSFVLANAYFDEKAKRQESKQLMVDSISIDTDTESRYLVGIRENHVIIFESDTDHVYEYTGIDADILKQLHPDVYEELCQMVEFNSKYEMYRYLESLES